MNNQNAAVELYMNVTDNKKTRVILSKSDYETLWRRFPRPGSCVQYLPTSEPITHAVNEFGNVVPVSEVKR